MARRSLSALLIEDNPNDVELVVAELERSGYDLRFEHVDSVKRLQNALAEGGWEIVISDYNVPGLDFWGGLAVVIEHGQDVPFIVASGTIREEAVAAAIRAGARDCVVKSNLTRLGFVVARELEDVATRRAHRETEETLRGSEELFRLLAENAADVVYRYRLLPELELEYISPAVTAVIGYTPEEHYADPGLRAKIVHPDDRPRLERMLTDPSPELVVLRWIGKDGEVVWVEQRSVGVRDDEGSLVAIEGIARDITPRIRLEEQLRHAQKLEAVGRLAGGISHDFNNLLLVIRGNCELALRGLEEGDPRHEELGEITAATERATDLTRQLLAFSRKQVVEPRALDLNATVTEMERMFQRLIGEDVELVTVLDPGLAPVIGDQSQIEQVIVNLVVNSRDAMGSGGRLTIRTENVKPGAAVPPSGIEPPERTVLLSVTDTGTGMDEATRTHLFEPYFTTKAAGEGTGLGLATVFGIVEQAGGWIEVASELGKGSTFTIFLPAGEELDAPEAEITITASAASGGPETLLLVEDNEQLRRLFCKMLELAGYTVIEAATGTEALAVAQRHDGPIDLLLSDVVMPEMGAQELLGHLLPLRPGLPVILMSGYVEAAIADLRGAHEVAAFLQKPFTIDALLASVREALARAK